jgi:hypothetical protein
MIEASIKRKMKGGKAPGGNAQAEGAGVAEVDLSE